MTRFLKLFNKQNLIPLREYLRKTLTINRFKQIRIGIAISITIIIVVSFLSYYSIKNMVSNFHEVEKTNKVLFRLENIAYTISKAESSLRAYKLLEKKVYLSSYHGSKDEALDTYRELKYITRDNPRQQTALAEIGKLIEDRYLLFEQLRRMSHTDSSYSKQLGIQLDRSTAIMRDLIEAISKMKYFEQALLNQRLEESNESATKAQMIIMLFLFTSIAIVILAFVTLSNEYLEKSKIEKQLLLSQEELKERLQKLDISNKDLEQFAYVASHDLQEPLRKIIAFSDQLNVKYQDQINPEVKDKLLRIMKSAARMRVLIEDLLNYSRVTRVEKNFVPVNFKSLINSILDDLEYTIQNQQAKVQVTGWMPILYGDETLLRQLFQNLITNALKFSKPDEPARIRITAQMLTPSVDLPSSVDRKGKKFCKIFISDNGIGFDQKYLNRIFVIFQRLHGRSEYEGTGIGLAICKKITDHHGGHITAVSELNKGTEFIVTLPVKT